MADNTALATRSADHWGGLLGAPRLIRDRENAVFEVVLRSGQRAALRLHRAGYQSLDAIEAELRWTSALADLGFSCPRPVPTVDNELVKTCPTGRAVSLVTWIDAKPIGESGVPFDAPLRTQIALYEQLGAKIAELHQLTRQIDSSGFSRASWDLDGLLGEAPLWGRFWENPSLTKAEVELLQAARRNAAQQLSEINALDIILIHADLIQENILLNKSGLHIIDFDDSGFGYPGYDLGTALIQHSGGDALEPLTDAICAGYGCDRRDMSLFIMLRSMASCGWIMTRAPRDDPKQRSYAERALICAQRFLKGI